MNPAQDYDFFVKICLQGPEGGGKSSLLARFLGNGYIESGPTKGLDVPKHKLLSLDGKEVKLQMWDIPGGNLWRESNKHHRGTQGFMIVFDLKDPAGLTHAMEELNDIQRYAADDVQKLLVGAQCDDVAKRTVDYDAARAFAQEHAMLYIETSARNDINVTDAFVLLSFLSMLKLQQAPVDSAELGPLVPTFSAAVSKLMHSGGAGVERSSSLELKRADLAAAAARPSSPARTASASVLLSTSPPSAVRERSGSKRGSRILSIFSSSKQKEKPPVGPLPDQSTLPAFLRNIFANLQFDYLSSWCGAAETVKGAFLCDDLAGDVYAALKRNSHLTSIECVGGRLTSLGLMKIGDLLRANASITSVLLEANGEFEKSGFEIFCNAFKRGHITQLRIRTNTLSASLVDVLAASAGLCRIRTLLLVDVQLEDKAFSSLATGLYSCSLLERLNVSGNCLRLDGATTLARLMMVLKSSLRVVEAARNQFGDGSLEILCAALYHSRVELFDVEENHFTVEAFAPLSKVLRYNLWLRRLHISAVPSIPSVNSLISTSIRASLRRNTSLLYISDNAATRGCRPFLDRNQAGNYSLDYRTASLVELAAVTLLQHALLYNPALLRSLLLRREYTAEHIKVLEPLCTMVEFGVPCDEVEWKRLVAVLRYHYQDTERSTSTTMHQQEMLARLRHSGVPKDLEAGLNKLRKLHPEYGPDELLLALEEAAGDVAIASTNLRGRANTLRKGRSEKKPTLY